MSVVLYWSLIYVYYIITDLFQSPFVTLSGFRQDHNNIIVLCIWNRHSCFDSRSVHDIIMCCTVVCSHIIISNRCGVSINTWRWTIAFSAGFVFITMPAGWIEKEPLIYFHSFFLPDPVSLVRLRFSYYYYYYYFQVKYTNVYVRVHTDCAPMTNGCHRGKKTMNFLFTPRQFNSHPTPQWLFH